MRNLVIDRSERGRLAAQWLQDISVKRSYRFSSVIDGVAKLKSSLLRNEVRQHHHQLSLAVCPSLHKNSLQLIAQSLLGKPSLCRKIFQILAARKSHCEPGFCGRQFEGLPQSHHAR